MNTENCFASARLATFTRPVLFARTSLVAAVALAATLANPVLAQDTPAHAPASAPATAQAEQRGKIVEGTVPVYTWAPKEDARRVDATNIDLPGVFADLGPVATQWYQHVITLSNPYFEGRAPGTRGMDAAADYVEFWMKRVGLEPAFPAATSAGGATPTSGDAAAADWTSHRQRFTLPGGMARALDSTVATANGELQVDKDFTLLAMCGTAETAALPIVFAGYAIEDGKDGYSSFDKDQDLKGKAVVFFRYEPLDANGKSRWADKRFSEHSAVGSKIEELTKRGAAAIVMVAPPGAADGRTTMETVESSRWGRRLDVPLVQLSIPAAERLLKSGDPDKKSLLEWRQLADDGKVKCVALGAGATLQFNTRLDSGGTPAENIGGVLRGKGALADQWLVVGAHYDHVGMGYFGSSPDNAGKLHPGADDNASGTAAMLLMAQQLGDLYAGKNAPQDARSILFLAFTAEESGLRGSKWWVEHPTVPADKLVMMLNMDMVGRLRSDSLSVYGTGTAEGFLDILRPVFVASELNIYADPSGRGPSDHASFYGAGIPVLFFNTGNHDIYHTPKDFGHTVNPAGAAKVVALGTTVTAMIATREKPLVFKSSDDAPTAGRGYASVRLGVMPGMSEEGADHPEGVLVESVSANTSAADAGIQKGDVLLKWNGDALADGRAMVTKLREHKPGDVVKMSVWRAGKTMEIDVTLKASTPRS